MIDLSALYDFTPGRYSVEISRDGHDLPKKKGDSVNQSIKAPVVWVEIDKAQPQ